MRVVIQRVREAAVDIAGKRIAEIGPGLMILVSLLGPCSASYGRYLYPIVMAMPILICMSVSFLREKEQIDG